MKLTQIKEIFLNSPQKKNLLIESYKSAISNAKEIYIASAYLTNWSTNVRLNSYCENLLFLVGTDFGITRKKACKDVIKWLPNRFYNNFLAVGSTNFGNFHPKIIAWKDFQNRFHCIIGSSNLTEAAFNNNYEANIEVFISEKEFKDMKDWLEDISKDCQVIDADWIKRYKETVIRGGPKSKIIKRVINLPIPNSKRYKDAIKDRRKNEKSFAKIKEQLKQDMILCSKGKISNNEFWNRFWSLWSNDLSRMQGSGIQLSGKNANWKEITISFVHVLESKFILSQLNLDNLIREEIDKLKKMKNPMRGSWFSEMLCHFFPDNYPLLNKPVKIYLKKNKWKHQRGLSEGGKYLDLTQKLRDVLKQNKNGPKNMPELDSVIWAWCKQRGY